MEEVMEIDNLVCKVESEIQEEFNKIDKICLYNTQKVLNAFIENNVGECHFNTTTGYGYNDLGRDNDLQIILTYKIIKHDRTRENSHCSRYKTTQRHFVHNQFRPTGRHLSECQRRKGRLSHGHVSYNTPPLPRRRHDRSYQQLPPFSRR